MERDCDICQKNKATIHVQQVMGNKEIDLHICDDCAFENGISREDDKIEVSLTGLFAGIMDVQGDLHRKINTVCPVCGLTIKQFHKDNRPGCPDCFKTFAKEIGAFYEEQGIGETFKGRLPKKLQIFRTLYEKRQRLHEDLETAVVNEDYERAAELRDRLRNLDESGE